MHTPEKKMEELFFYSQTGMNPKFGRRKNYYLGRRQNPAWPKRPLWHVLTVAGSPSPSHAHVVLTTKTWQRKFRLKVCVGTSDFHSVHVSSGMRGGVDVWVIRYMNEPENRCSMPCSYDESLVTFIVGVWNAKWAVSWMKRSFETWHSQRSRSNSEHLRSCTSYVELQIQIFFAIDCVVNTTIVCKRMAHRVACFWRIAGEGHYLQCAPTKQ